MFTAIWAVAAALLIVLELLTGTFFLLVLGIAAIAGAILAGSGHPLIQQALVFGFVALVGVLVLKVTRRRTTPAKK